MRIEDEPLDDFYPVCSICHNKIYGTGYKFGGEICCEDCFEPEEFYGPDEAKMNREQAFEEARERFSDV